MQTGEICVLKGALGRWTSLRVWLLLFAFLVVNSSTPLQVGLRGVAEGAEGGGGKGKAFFPCPRMVFTTHLSQTEGSRTWTVAHIGSVSVDGGTPFGIWTADTETSFMANDLSPDCVHIVGVGGTLTASGLRDFLWLGRVDQPGVVTLLSPEGYHVSHAVWLPDAATIVYEATYDEPNRVELRAIGMNRQGDRLIADLGSRRLGDIGPIPSPDGSKIVLAMSEGWDIDIASDLWLVDVGTGQLTRITDTPNSYEDMPLFSPDGNLLAYIRAWVDWEQDPPAYETRIHVKNLSSGEDRVVATHSGLGWAMDLNNFRTQWNAEGTEFLALVGTSVVGEDELVETTLYRIPADGSGPIAVIRHPGCQIFSPGWTTVNGSPVIRYQLLCLEQPVRVFVVRPDGSQNQEIPFAVADEEYRLALLHR